MLEIYYHTKPSIMRFTYRYTVKWNFRTGHLLKRSLHADEFIGSKTEILFEKLLRAERLIKVSMQKVALQLLAIVVTNRFYSFNFVLVS